MFRSCKKSGFSLRFVKHQTNEICLKAVKYNKNAILYVDDQIKEYVCTSLKIKLSHDVIN